MPARAVAIGLLFAACFVLVTACWYLDSKSQSDPPQPKDSAAAAPEWIELFNGRDLSGWTPKITGYALGENFGDTFRVDNGVLKVAYDQYEKFEGRFGHLFYNTEFSDYVIELEYRFTGSQTPGGPGWAFRNSGIMIHGQTAASMGQDQNFPVSIEVQLLGGDGTNERHTHNLCTPGTHVVMNDKLIKRHCSDSNSKTYHGDQWVKVRTEVHGHGLIRHLIDGKVVLEYEQSQLDDNDADAKKLIATRSGERRLSGGTISLQAESHPCEFRNIRLKRLSEN
ncbi:MAG: DUF1080 domain-containing protein [Planctomycetota bacterium]